MRSMRFDPATNRITVHFRDGGGVTRGSTSVALEKRGMAFEWAFALDAFQALEALDALLAGGLCFLR